MPDVQGAPQVTGSGFVPMMGNFSNYGWMNNPALMDPQWQQAMIRQQYAQSLMSQGTETTPLRSPWQAAARVLQGALGGYMMNQAADQMQQYAEGSRKALADQYGSTPILNYPPAPPLGGGGGGGATAPVTATTPGAVDPASLVPRTQAQAMIAQRESGNQNIYQKGYDIPPGKPGYIPPDKVGSGYYQFIPATWKEAQNLAGIPPEQQTAAAIDASKENQDKGFLALYDKYGVAPWRASAKTTFVTPGSTSGMGNTDIAALRAASDNAQNYGTSLALQYRQMAINAAQSPYAAVRAMAPQWQQQSLSFAEYGRYTPVGTNSDGQLLMMDRQNGKVDAIGAPQQLIDIPGGGKGTVTGQPVLPSAVQQLIELGKTPWEQMNPAQQSRFAGILSSEFPPTGRWDEKQGMIWTPNPNIPPGIKLPPGYLPQAFPGTTPGQTPAPTTTTTGGVPVTQPVVGGGTQTGQPTATPTTVANQQNQIADDRKQAGDWREVASEGQQMRFFTDQIRAYMASHNVNTGALAPMALQINRLMTGLGWNQQLADNITHADPAAGEMLNKLFTQLNTTAARTMAGGHTGSEVAGLFMNNYPSIESRPQTINEFTRGLDLQNAFQQRRSELAQQWITEHQNDPPGAYKPIGSPEFNAWAKAQGLDPKIYAAAALMAGGQPHKMWAEGLRDPDPKQAARNVDTAAHLAWSIYPRVGIQQPNGNFSYGPGQ